MTRDSVEELLEQIGRGEAEALGELFTTYAPYLRAVVRGRLSADLRSKFDSVDVVQSVWVQVLDRLRADGWRVNDEDHLRALLVTIARRRLASRARRCTLAAEADFPADCWPAVPDARHGTPSETVRADDLWARMLALVPAEHHPVLQLRRDGLPLAEIADRTGMHEGSVRRILRRLARELALREQPLAETGPEA
jgi:RNA polymerase sigma-70 factor (ECF subfamily)